MATDKPKLQGYVERELLDRFTQWKSERGIEKDSAALNELLREFFGVPHQVAPPANLEDLVEALVEKKLDSRIVELEAKIIEAMVEQRVGNLPSNPPSDTETLSQLADDYGELHDHFQELESRVSSLENAVPVTGRSPSNWHTQTDGLPSELPSNPLPSETEKPKPISLSLTGLSGVELAKRLGVNPATLIKNRGKSAFEEWSKARDPQALAWRYAADIKRYELSLRR